MHINKKLERARSTIEARQTTENDLPLILGWESNEPNVLQWKESDHIEFIQNPDAIYQLIVAKKSGESVGYAILKRNSPDPSSVEFLRLVIADEFKSRGYGSLYFEYIWNLVFSDQTIQRIWHDVFTDNEVAVRLYEKLGYSKFKETIEPRTGRTLFHYELTREQYLAKAN